MATAKPMVALDLDDLIFPFMDTVVPFVNVELGTSLCVEDFFTFNFEEVFGGTRDQSVALMEKFFAQLDNAPTPVAGAEDAIAKLSTEFSLAIITSRTDQMRDRTLDWVETHFPATFVEVHLTNNFVTDNRPTKRRKVDVCKELGAIALVDDRFESVNDVHQAGITGILFGDFAWNRDIELPQGVTRALDWNEVTDELLALR